VTASDCRTQSEQAGFRNLWAECSFVTEVRPTRVLLALALVLAWAVVIASSASADTGQLAIIQDDALLQSNLPGTLQTMRELGATQVRYPLRWASVAPDPNSRHRPHHFAASNPASYPAGSWAFDDALVDQAQADGLSVEFQLTGGAPRWAEGPGEPKGGPAGVWKPNATEYGGFVKAVGTRYSGRYTPRGTLTPLPRVNFWGLWNEPNFGQDLAPQATDDDALELSTAMYRSLLSHAWNALAATGHRHDTILVGDTAPHGHAHPIGDFDGIAPLRFIRVLYCLNPDYQTLIGIAASLRGCPTTTADSRHFRTDNPALFDATGFAIHPYASSVPPDQSQPGSVTNAADLAAIPNLEDTLDRVYAAYGDARKVPIYNTEYGYQVSKRVSAKQAAYYINWAEYLTYQNPRVKSYAQYLLDDPTNGGFETGLFDDVGRPKSALEAYRMPLYMPMPSVDHARTLHVWGGVRPAHFAQLETDTRQLAALQFRARGTSTFTTIDLVTITSERGYFNVHLRFSRSGTLRSVWTDPMGTTYHSRYITVSVGRSASAGVSAGADHIN
jgi:hypothetical protein